MRFLSFFLFFLLFFPSFAQSNSTCEYARDQLENYIDGAPYDSDTNYGYATNTEAWDDCYGSHPGTCTFVNMGGVTTYYSAQYDPDAQKTTRYWYSVCTECTDSCPFDNTCDEDQCEAAAECACANRGGVVWAPDDPDHENCDYECRCEDDPVAECAPEVFYWTNEPQCLYECMACDHESDSPDCVDTCEYGGIKTTCGGESGVSISFCNCNPKPNEPGNPQGYIQDPKTDPDDEEDGDEGPSNPPGGSDSGDGSEPYDGDPGGTGSSPDPDSSEDPDNDPEKCMTCAEAQSVYCRPACQWACGSDANGCWESKNCDCYSDPESGTDNAGGWTEAVEENTDRAANEAEENNDWNEAIKHNQDEQLEDSDRIADNQERGNRNDAGYFGGRSGGSVFKDGQGNSHLQTISDNTAANGEATDEMTDLLGEIAENTDPDGDPEGDPTDGGTAPGDNAYDSTVGGTGFETPEDTFAEDLSTYISSGIPLVSWIQDSSINLSSSSSLLSFSFYGQSVNVDFSPFVGAIDLAGNILFALTVLSSFMLIITRVKG